MKKYKAICLLLPLFVASVEAQSFYSGQAARAVIGQSTFSAGTSNAQAYILGGASGVAYGNGYIWIADSNKLGYTPSNHRVLLFAAGQIPGPRVDVTQYPSGDAQCTLCGFSAVNVIGQTDFVSSNPGRSSSPTAPTATASGQGYMNHDSGVATDGTILAVADTDNNRILIWNSLPLSSSGIPPSVVVGQTNFTNGTAALGTNGLAGPVGVWIQNGKLFVADTSNSRVLIWNSIPTQNGQPADLVLGEPNFGSNAGTAAPTAAAANRLYFPTSVTSDGTRLFVADEGFNRILIWNSIPTANDQPADLVLGQPDMVSQKANNTSVCGGGTLCAAGLNLPQFALSDGTRLYVSDTGNDRVLIYNTIPTSNSPTADVVLGQPNFTSDIVTSQTVSITSTVIDNTGAVDTIPSPTALAWDGTNLYVTDPANRRVLVFNPADTPLPDYSVVNAASGPDFIRQEGIVTIFAGTGKITAGDTITITIQGTVYTYTVVANDTLDSIAQGLVKVINSSNSGAGDPYVTALFAGAGTSSVYLSSKVANPGFDAITLTTATSTSGIDETSVASGAYLTSGTAATGAAGMLVQISGTSLSDITTTNATQIANSGVQVFMDGFSAHITSLSPSTILAEVPATFANGTAPITSTTSVAGSDRNSISIYVRTVHSGGNVTITNATPLYIAPANPGIFDAPAFPGQARPWPATQATHQSGNPNAVISVDGTVHTGDVATITIAGKAYTYTVVASDSLESIRDRLHDLINSAPDPYVTASFGAAFDRIVLTAIQSGSAGAGISVTAGVTGTSATLSLTAYSASTCCNVTPNSPITPANPAAPGELITLTATGLGVATNGTATNTVTATLGGSGAQVVSAGLAPGSNSSYDIQLIVPTNLSPNQYTQLYVAQNAFISNIVTIPVGSAVQAAPPGAGVAQATVIVSPPAMVFGNQNLGSSSTTQTITVYNPSAIAAQVLGSVQLTGANAGSFIVSSNTCPAAGSALAAEGTCTVTITYNTGGTGVNSATLNVSDAAGLAHTVSLLGYSVPSFEIMSRLSGKALDVTGVSTSDGAIIQQWDYLSGANQHWSFLPVGNGAFTIQNALSGKVLDVQALSTSDGALVQQWDSLGTANQQWTLLPTNGYTKIQNVNSGKVLDVAGTSTADGAQIQQWDNYADPGNQQWAISPVQYYEIVNLNSGLALDVQGVSPFDSALVQQYAYVGGANQQWQLVPVPGSSFYFSIMSRNSGKVLDVTGESTQSGAQIQQYDSLLRSNQEWAFLASSVPGAFAIVNQASGRVLDVTAVSTANGALIQQWDYLGTPNQLWTLVPVGVQ